MIIIYTWGAPRDLSQVIVSLQGTNYKSPFQITSNLDKMKWVGERSTQVRRREDDNRRMYWHRIAGARSLQAEP